MGLNIGALATLLATGFYLSYIPSKLVAVLGLPAARKWTGAGFVGTLEGLAVVPLLPEKPDEFALFLVAAVLLSCWLCGRAERVLGVPDDPRIVLDETVGYWAAIAFLPRTLKVLGIAFVLFRALDSIKLPPYRYLERLPGGWGVVFDDVGAAIFANLGTKILLCYWPWLNH